MKRSWRLYTDLMQIILNNLIIARSAEINSNSGLKFKDNKKKVNEDK